MSPFQSQLLATPRTRPRWIGHGQGLGRWFELELPDGTVAATVEHCGHPTALRPWYTSPATRCWSSLRDAQLAAAGAAGLPGEHPGGTRRLTRAQRRG